MFTMTGTQGLEGNNVMFTMTGHTGTGGKQCNVYNDWAHRDWRETM